MTVRRRRPGVSGRRAAALAVVLALAASACAASDGPTGAPAGILRIGLERPQSLDPAKAQYVADLIVVDQLFDGLTAYDPATLGVRPSIASRWEVTPDQRSWTFSLREDAKFSNGRTITADDVKYTLERIARRGSDSPAAPQLEPVVGYEAFHNDGRGTGLEGVTTPSAGTVKIDLSYPLSSFAAVLAHPSFGIVPREAVEAAAPKFAEQPVGSGPFMFRSRSLEVLRLMRAPGARTELEGIEIYMGRDSDAPYSAFLRGQLDWTAVPTERVDEVVRDRGRAGFAPYPAQLFYGFNLRNPKYQDVRFREAILRAIDREAIVREIYRNRVRPLNGVVAAGVPGHQADPCGEKCRYDPARSRALLAEAFPNRPVPEVRIDYDEDPTQEAVAHAIAAGLRAVDIPVALRPHSFTDYVRFAASGQQELFRLAWIGAYASPDAFLGPLFYSGKPDNVTGYTSNDFDALVRAAREEPDRAKADYVYQVAEQLIMHDLPVVPIAQYETHTLVSSRVRDLTMSAFGTFDASEVKLAR